MKNLEKIKFHTERLLKRNSSLLVISTVIATLLFITVNQAGNPIWLDVFKTTEYIQSVPITVEYDKEEFVVSGIPSAIPVTITGSENDVRSEMNKVGALFGTITINHKTPGEYSISSSEIKFNTLSSVSVTPSTPEFNVKVQRKIHNTMPVDISYINGGTSDAGYLLKTPILSESVVTITGGNDDIESVVAVIGFVDLSELKPNEEALTQDFTVSLVPYNKSGSVVNNIQIDPVTIIVTQPYELSSVILPISYEFINNETGKYVSSICDVKSDVECDDRTTPTVKVYGNSEKISQLENIKYKVDLQDFKTLEGEVKGTPILDTGVYVLGEYEKTYNIKIEEGETKVITGVQPRVSSLDSTFQAKAINSDDAIIDVEVTGAKSIINELTANDIVLSIDLSSATKAGIITVPIQVKKNKNFDYKLSVELITIEIIEVTNE
ncbi:MAG: hypothetical protein JJV90_01500 [Spiroplasma sp.]|nr:hypothetical protein [Mycoplasmatales bacterium]